MKKIEFYDIYVYRLSEDSYNFELSNTLQRHMGKHEQFLIEHPQYKVMYAEGIIRNFGGEWRYNEIIGYIRLYLYGTQIRGEYYQNNKKQIRKTRKKQFVWICEKILDDVNLPLRDGNKAICQTIIGYLEKCKNDKRFKNRFIDTESFNKLAPCIDWLRLIDN